MAHWGAPDSTAPGGRSDPGHHVRHRRSRLWRDHRNYWQLAVVVVVEVLAMVGGAGIVLDDAVADWLPGAPNAMSGSPHVIRF